MRIHWKALARKVVTKPAVAAIAVIVALGSLAAVQFRPPAAPSLPQAMHITLPKIADTSFPPPTSPPPQAAPAGKSLATETSWLQDFTRLPAGALDSKIWKYDIGGHGWGNNEVQYYTNRTQNAQILGGRLVLTATREDFNGSKYTSARVNTRGTFHMQYGRLVFHDVRLPQGIGTWPAIWLWPAGAKYSKSHMQGGGDVGLVNGEIDIMEYVGAAPGELNASAHAYANFPKHNERSGQTIITDNLPHDLSLDWTPESLTFSVNSKPYYTVKNPHTGPHNWPYDQPYFLIINLAMGGDWGGMLRDTYPPDGIDNTKTSWQFSVGSIRYYPLK